MRTWIELYFLQFYTDPISGNVFCSKKDALCYLETGEFGSQAFKCKDKSNDNMKLEDDETCSPAVAEKLKSAVNETSSVATSDHSSKLSGNVEDKQILNPASTGECMPLSDQASGGSGIALSSSEFPMGRVSIQVEATSDCTKSIRFVAPAVSGLPDKHLVDGRISKNETKRPELSGSKKKKDFDLPRRASKRLAGIPLDPVPELEACNRARRAQSNKAMTSAVAVKESNEAVASTSEGSSSDNPISVVLPDSNKGNQPITNVATTDEQALERETDSEGYKKHETANFSPLMDLATEQSAVKSETASTSDQKLGLPLDLPFGELWQDPCIAFAIKTLTGISFDDNSDSMKVSQGSNNSEFGAFGNSEEHAQIEDTGNGGELNQGCRVVLPLGNLTIPEEPTVEDKRTQKSDKQPDIPFNFPSMDSWSDPSIEFAIKTLTDAIPLDYNMIFQDHQQASSSQSQERGGSTFAKCG
uniref:Uncharacterized protein MANES_14G027100 n=2 Tax=Rhizophora mucronata TaxID=61149 RepID=A0A2P2K5Q8_RHIMU